MRKNTSGSTWKGEKFGWTPVKEGSGQTIGVMRCICTHILWFIPDSLERSQGARLSWSSAPWDHWKRNNKKSTWIALCAWVCTCGRVCVWEWVGPLVGFSSFLRDYTSSLSRTGVCQRIYPPSPPVFVSHPPSDCRHYLVWAGTFLYIMRSGVESRVYIDRR